MYKKLLSIVTLFAVLGIGTTAKAEGTYTDSKGVIWTNVSTAQEFSDAVTSNHAANVRLVCDINLGPLSAGSSDYLFEFTFTGKILGDGIEANGDSTNFALLNTQHTLFKRLEDATIKGLVIGESSFEGRDDMSGMLADDCINTTINGMMLCNIRAEGNINGYDADNMGGIVGKAWNSHFQNIVFFNCQLITDGARLGCVAGTADNCDFIDCSTSAQSLLWADGNTLEENSGFVGGICGSSYNCRFNRCTNLAVVSSDDDRIGGITGYAANGTTLTDCLNAGVVKHCTRLGFGRVIRQEAERVLNVISFSAAGSFFLSSLLWYNAGSLMNLFSNTSYFRAFFDSCLLYQMQLARPGLNLIGNIANNPLIRPTIRSIYSFAFKVLPAIQGLSFIVYGVTYSVAGILHIYDVGSAPDEIGGIVGTAVGNSTILRCSNYGMVDGDDVDCGGIAGRIESSTIESCYNSNFVRGGEHTAGIVGYCENSKVTNNLNVGQVTGYEHGYYGITCKESGTNTVGGNFFLADEYKNHNTCYSITQEQLASGWVAKQLNSQINSAIWRQNLRGESIDFYPSLHDSEVPLVYSTIENPNLVQKIYSGGQFCVAMSNPHAHLSLQNDIDVSGIDAFLSTPEYPFRGHIEGNGFTISGYCHESSQDDHRNIDGEGVGPNNIAWIPYATGAIFENFVIDNFYITQRDENSEEANTEALLVATSNGCKYTNITIRNSGILKNGDDWKWIVGGIVAKSSSDYFTDCTIESTCRLDGVGGFYNYDTYVGGIASKASESMFVRCHNAGTIDSEDDINGGICGYAAGCGFVSCLNSGTVTGQTHLGGIVGYAGSCEIKKCVNVGAICGDENNGDNDHIAGIVGTLENPISRVEYCLSFGDLRDIDSDNTNGAIIGEWIDKNDANYVSNLYYYSHKGQNRNNLSDFGYTYDDLLSGKVAYYFMATNDENPRFLYQSLDNDPFCTDLPVPIPAAGVVYQNHLCFTDATEKHYSNLYQNPTGYEHNGQAHLDFARWGFCTVCGNSPSDITIPTEITINNAEDLVTLSKGVSISVDYGNTDITLTSDLDFEGITDFMPIGTSIEHPYSGFFYGNGHRIKNLHINRTSEQTGVGLFGVVTDNTRIDGIIMDKSCSVDGNNSLGVGGLVGCVMTSAASQSGKLQVYNCGNEANVRGGENVAGLVGGVYDKAHDGSEETSCSLVIWDCYNAGSISGNKVCAALVGYAHLWVQANHCFNIGNVSGYISGHHMIHYNKEKANEASFSRLYQLESLPADENIKATATVEQFCLGDVAEKLNYNETVEDSRWHQNLGTDEYPIPLPTPNASGKTIYHERSMSSDWGTAILPYAVQSNDDVQLYALETTDITGTDASITLKEIESVDENTPFFFKKKNASATSVSLDMADDGNVTLPAESATSVTQATNADGWSLTGSYRNQSYLTNVYFMAQNKLWYAEDPIEVPSFRAYLTSKETSASNKPIRILVHGENSSTQIGEIRDGEAIFFDQPIYNLSGQRVSKDSKGIMVTNGKKVIIK